MSALPEGLHVRPMTRGEAREAARLHGRQLGLPDDLLPALQETYEALLDSPLTVLAVLAGREGVVGLALATTDRQRLVSDLFSRRPGAVLAGLATRPGRTLRVLGILRGGVRRPGTTAELLDLVVAPEYRGQGLGRRLLEAAVEGLRRRGAEEVWAALPSSSPEAWGALEAAGFQREPQAKVLRGREGAVLRGLVPDPGWSPGPFGTADRLRCALRLEMLVLFPIYGLALIPFASLLAWLGCRLDRKVGLPPVLPEPWNLGAMALLLFLGGLLLVWSYSYLILEGEGGPVPPFSAKTRRLVMTGPYAVVRHPSILAKLLGVVGLGCGFNSWSFLFGIIPMLLAWSILWNGSRQDGDLVRVFGQEYLDYRNRTPMLVPRLRGRRP